LKPSAAKACVPRATYGDEVRISHDTNIYRVLFAPLGRYSQILLSLDAFQKKTRRTPLAKIDVAERRLADWRRQGAARAALKG